ncbi:MULTISPECIES: response regulator [Trichocoleus]|uniref:Response regulator n=1 Tax=Trichocoleus desertorum GB2-A4 TaxID=2933944 RepID=A0ABV0JE51_9CYAN|nr:response regulator [Trichocoleus sp. FACHB-46]MBD1863009.1 response regulator [Trichocoleus sp. FACHB-46]
MTITELHNSTTVKERILIVEDNELHRLITHDCLEAEGYTVLSLPDGLNFFSALAEFQPGLLLLDLKLPCIDGLTLLQQLKSSAWSAVPVIVASAYAFQSEKQKAIDLGACAYLTKPIALENLVKTIEVELKTAYSII